MGQLLNLRVFDSFESLVVNLSEAISLQIKEVLSKKEHFDLVLTGGNTPRPLFKYLAQNYRDKIPWNKIQFFWSDERNVPHNDSQSNYGMAKELLLDNVPINPANIFSMPTSFATPAEAAAEYEKTLKSQFDSSAPHFDLALLGLGEDCHVASLFPHQPTLSEKSRWVVASISPKEPLQRLSLTFPVINRSEMIYFLVTGENKAEPLRRALSKERIEIEDCPARGVRPVDGEIVWWVDKKAARLVE
ncbi:MAG TPA: 6-phosphogluconolactonase [candidate division Zixibacteria bacterium]|jgi:6-phosphogluconolactonase|nr:6-phosphogluconolactonase [candidate division Zixibacteria bacterium]